MNDWLFHRARATPDATALVSAESGTAWSYAGLDEEVERLAGQLASLGLTTGDHLGVLMETCVEFVRLIHAAGRLGVVLVPLNARLTAEELAVQAERADLMAIVCSADTEQQAVEAADGVPVASIDGAQWEGVVRLQKAVVGDFERGTWDLDDTKLLLFTSGTTGQPKPVRLTAGNLQTSAVASAFRLGVVPDDRWLVTLPMYHMGGLAPVLRCALYGTTVVVREGFDPGPTADDIGEFDVTGVSVVPTMLTRMLDARGTLSDSLRFVLLGGAPAPAALIERCRDYSVPVHPTYGMTETASQVATAGPTDAFDFAGTVGRPLMWTDVTVIDDDGNPLPSGETGELVVSGPSVSPGYYDDVEATAAATCKYGLRTGDIGKQDESGRLWVLNRKDDTIITGGENVQPGDVASAIREFRDVREVAVVGVPDEEWGERIGALVVPRREDLTVADIEAHCEESLADFKRPRLIVLTEELPRTASGTVKRDAVRKALLDSERVDVADAEEEAAAIESDADDDEEDAGESTSESDTGELGGDTDEVDRGAGERDAAESPPDAVESATPDSDSSDSGVETEQGESTGEAAGNSDDAGAEGIDEDATPSDETATSSDVNATPADDEAIEPEPIPDADEKATDGSDEPVDGPDEGDGTTGGQSDDRESGKGDAGQTDDESREGDDESREGDDESSGTAAKSDDGAH